jgi:hypothetical protein
LLAVLQRLPSGSGLPESALSGLLWDYLAASLAAVVAFASPRFARLGYWILFALLFYRGFFLFQDYRLRLNQHYMLYWSMFAFLFVSGKRVAIRYLVVLFYFWAGIIKLNPEWISGAALYGESLLLIPDSLIPAACIYVVILELFLIFGLLSRRALWFWATLAQLAMFHLISWNIVGFYYPLLMACILSIFVLERYIRPPPQPELPGAPSLARGRRVALGVLLGGFFSIQFLPYAYPGDSAITGEGRFFALHMFDAPIECQAVVLKTSKGGQQARNLSERVHCDPIVFWSMAPHLSVQPRRSRLRRHRCPRSHTPRGTDRLATRHRDRSLLRDEPRVSGTRAQRLDSDRLGAAVRRVAFQWVAGRSAFSTLEPA